MMPLDHRRESAEQVAGDVALGATSRDREAEHATTILEGTVRRLVGPALLDALDDAGLPAFCLKPCRYGNNSRWNLKDWKTGAEPSRRSRILFLADRNNLADQAYNDFTSFAAFSEEDNIDTYAYFGEPVYIYSLKEGINDGFLTPFKVKQISTTLDEYVYTTDDKLIEGEIESGRRYTESDFNRIIEIKEREAHRVGLFIDMIDQREKTLVFCATQDHALAVRT